MRVGNRNDRAVLLRDDLALDIEKASDGLFPSDLRSVFDRWDEVHAWGHRMDGGGWEPCPPDQLGPAVPAPRQSIGIGLNYRAHAIEGGWPIPDIPLVFAKLPSSFVGACDDIVLRGDMVDYEVELVVVIGRTAADVPVHLALSHVAGLTVGQDISDRQTQRATPGPQLTLAKSYRSFGPLGPAVVCLDELQDPDDLSIRCELNGSVVQDSRTSDLIFPISELVSFLSSRLTLYPGDVIFTGTPEGVGVVREPPRLLREGDIVVSCVEGVGTMRNRCVAGPDLAG